LELPAAMLRRRLPFTQPVLEVALITEPVDAIERVFAPVVIRPYGRPSTPESVREVPSVTPFPLKTVKVSTAALEKLPKTSMRCGALPANRMPDGVAGLKLSVAPDFTRTLPRRLTAPVMFTLTVPWLTTRLSMMSGLAPVGVIEAAALYSKSA